MAEPILVVDDTEVVRTSLIRLLQRAGHDVTGCSSGAEALDLLRGRPFSLVITDIRMPGMSGIELLRQISAEYPETLVLIITAHGSLDTALEALRLGAQDYVLKPFSFEEMMRRVSNLVSTRDLQLRVRRYRLEAQERFDTNAIVGDSPAMIEVQRLIDKAAPSGSTVLIQGESGTGKELVARAIHDRSPVAERDFIPVMLGAQPDSLVDAMLFGHEKGSFTGASRRREGVFRAARGGTVFLDEVSELPMDVQTRMLRVIENREVMPIGSDRPFSVDFRLVTATNKPLQELVDRGSFRADLFYRLNVFQIRVPPLRERLGDIPALATHFLHRHGLAVKKPAKKLTNEAVTALMGYGWPGNVRELSNVLERALLLSEGDWIGLSDLPLDLTSLPAAPTTLKDAMDLYERNHIQMVLAQVDQDKIEASKRLDVHLSTLYRRMARLGLDLA